MWALQTVEQPMVQVLAVPSLEANKNYAELVLEVLMLGILLSLARSCARLPNEPLSSLSCDSPPLPPQPSAVHG